jgi:hypothetical protein
VQPKHTARPSESVDGYAAVLRIQAGRTGNLPLRRDGLPARAYICRSVGILFQPIGRSHQRRGTPPMTRIDLVALQQRLTQPQPPRPSPVEPLSWAPNAHPATASAAASRLAAE